MCVFRTARSFILFAIIRPFLLTITKQGHVQSLDHKHKLYNYMSKIISIAYLLPREYQWTTNFESLRIAKEIIVKHHNFDSSHITFIIPLITSSSVTLYIAKFNQEMLIEQLKESTLINFDIVPCCFILFPRIIELIRITSSWIGYIRWCAKWTSEQKV